MRTAGRAPWLLALAITGAPGCWVLSKDEVDQHDFDLLADGDTDGGTDTDTVPDTDGDTDTTPPTDTVDPSACTTIAPPDLIETAATLTTLPGGEPLWMATGAFVPGQRPGFAMGTLTGEVLAYVADPAFDFQYDLAGTTSAGAASPDGVVGDVDGRDGLDVFGAAPTALTLPILFGTGYGQFGAGIVTTSEGPQSVDVAQLDGDALPDAIFILPDEDRLAIVPGNDSGRLSDPFLFGDPLEGGRLVRAIDLDGDGYPEVVAVSQTGTVRAFAHTGEGIADWAPRGVAAAENGADPSGIVWGDFDLDGDVDLATIGRTGGYVNVFTGDNAGGLTWAQSIGIGSQPVGLAAIPLDGGCFALATAQRGTGTLVILGPTGPARFGAPDQRASGVAIPAGIAAGSFDDQAGTDLIVVGADGSARAFRAL